MLMMKQCTELFKNSSEKRYIQDREKRGKKNRPSKKDSISPGISHSKHWNNLITSSEKMKFILQAQLNKTQESELSLTPRRNLRTGPDKFYFFKNLTLCPTKKFKCLFKLKGREKCRHLSICYIRRPWKIGNKEHFPDEKWSAKNKAGYVKEINGGSQRAWGKAAEDPQRCVRVTWRGITEVCGAW